MKLNYGIASPSTITRMLSGIDEELALYAFMEWIGEIVDSKNTHLAIDGKALRGAAEKTKSGTAPMLLNVVETVRGLILAQLPVDSKTNEITVIPELLKLLDIRGSVITIDAIGTQTAIMEQIHEQEADGDEYHEHHHLLGLFAHSTFRIDTCYLEASRNPIQSPVPRYREPSPRSE